MADAEEAQKKKEAELEARQKEYKRKHDEAL